MHNSSAMQPLDDFDQPIAPMKFKAPLSRSGGKKAARPGALGPVAAASSRGGAASPRTEPRNPGGKARSGAASPLVWTLAALAGWALLVGGRAPIVRLAPATASIYSALGLPVNLRQMDFENVVSKLAEEDGREILVVEGDIRNLADSPRTAPPMRLSVRDAQGAEIYTWTASPQKARLAAGEKASFRARLAAPPAQGRDVLVKFAATPDRQGNSDRAGSGS